MYSTITNVHSLLGEFHIEGMMLRYSSFVPRLYNLARSLGFEAGKIVPSRAFCSDESQGYPIILITKHFGTFPFNHGRVGGIVATDRHAPHAEHGKDMVIIHASHVGYDPDQGCFGTYRRLQTEHAGVTPNCGKISGVLDWYLQEFDFARESISLERDGSRRLVNIDNQLLRANKAEGLLLHLEQLAQADANGKFLPLRSFSTGKTFIAAPSLIAALSDSAWPSQGRRSLDKGLRAEMFSFKRNIPEDPEVHGHLELNLLPPMPWILTSESPMLTAALVNTQVEYDRTFRTIVKEQGYQGKNLLYVAGLNIDISPRHGQIFPLTKFVPWAAFVQTAKGERATWEQGELMARLLEQSPENPEQIELDVAIQEMEQAKEIRVRDPRAF